MSGELEYAMDREDKLDRENVVMREALERIAAYKAVSHGGWADETLANLEAVQTIARHTLASLSPSSTNEEGDAG